MPTNEYLNEVYYLNGAFGSDAPLWNNNDNKVAPPDVDNVENIKGYYPRLKKINDALRPIADEISGEKIDLVQYQSEEKVAKSTYDAALSGIGTTAEDFKALVGVYPEDAQEDKIKSIEVKGATVREAWADFAENENGFDKKHVIVDENSVEVKLKVTKQDYSIYPTIKDTVNCE
jgi:hypothetical protein